MYYRLKTIDKDGKYTYSKTVALRVSGEGSRLFFYPNPTTHDASLVVSVKQKEEALLQLFDLSGKLLQSKRVDLQKGSNSLAVDVSKLAAGIYTVMVKGGRTNELVQFIKQQEKQ